MQAFRQRVQQGGEAQLYYKDFADFDEFREVLRQDLSLWLAGAERPWFTDRAGREVTIEAPPPGLALHQLPGPPGDFVGREDELRELAEKLRDGGVAISGVQGMAGIGKTGLALVLGGQLKEEYPDAQFFLDLKGTEKDRTLKPTDAMAHVLRGFFPEAKLPEKEAELRGMYMSALSAKRALLLMDNAAGAAQVEPLIPPAGCVLLVTSRTRFTLPGMFSRDLDTLPPDKARLLLTTIAPRLAETPDAADRIAELCAYLPLALRVSGKALAERPDLDIDDYVGRLADERNRLPMLERYLEEKSEGIEASIRLSEGLLNEEQRDRWYALAVFPGDFERRGAAAVWELDEDAARDALSEFRRYSLLEWNKDTGRYRLHDLLRLFADARLADPARTTAQRRHAEHYCDVLATANEMYLSGGDQMMRGLALFDLEWPNVGGGFGWVAQRSETDDDAAELCSRYLALGAYCLELRQHPVELIAWLESALTAARRLGDRSRQGLHLGLLGVAHAQLGNPSAAVKYFEQGLVAMRETGNRREEAKALGNLGNTYSDLGEARRAIEFYEQVLTITREIGDRRGEGATLANLGLAHKNLGQARRAIDFLNQALPIMREIGDPRGEGETLGKLGMAYGALGDPGRAIECHEQALVIRREIGDRRGEAHDLGNLGATYARLDKPRRAIEYYEQALAIACETGDRRGEAITRWNMGKDYAKLGDVGRAMELMQVLVDYYREIGHPDADKHAAIVQEFRRRLKGKN